jgi:4-hydroxy-3-polyprenylbenzoate decarboxylase
MNNQYEKTFVIAICGATGVVLGIRLLKYLLEKPFRIYLIISEAAYKVIQHETGFDGREINNLLNDQGMIIHHNAKLTVCNNTDYFISPASGSFRHDGMVIAPCSMKTLGAIANGINDNLIPRSADVALKEKRQLILVTRETPLNLVHIRNMEKAHLAGAMIMPPVLSFYGEIGSVYNLIDVFIGRVLDHLNVSHSLYREWGQ